MTTIVFLIHLSVGVLVVEVETDGQYVEPRNAVGMARMQTCKQQAAKALSYLVSQGVVDLSQKEVEYNCYNNS